MRGEAVELGLITLLMKGPKNSVIHENVFIRSWGDDSISTGLDAQA